MQSKQVKESSPKMLVDIAFENIRRDISEEFLKQGERINVRVLSERYNISETPIKQALNRMMMRGIVESMPRKGMWVRRMTWEEIDEMMELRLMMELNFAPQVMKAIGASLPIQNEFESNLRKCKELVATPANTFKEFAHFFDIDIEFHRIFLTSSGNRTAVKIFDNLNTHSVALYLYQSQPHQRTVQGLEEHRQIYDVLKEGKDVDKVREMLKIHIHNAKDNLYLILKTSRSL